MSHENMGIIIRVKYYTKVIEHVLRATMEMFRSAAPAESCVSVAIGCLDLWSGRSGISKGI